MNSSKWKDLFSFSSRERNGIFILVIIILILTVFRIWAPYDKKNADIRNFSQFESEIDDFENSLKSEDIKTSYEKKSYDDNSSVDMSVPLSEFNPNKASYQKLLKLGFSKNLADNLINYREAGGQFYNPDDMQKLYGMSDEFYQHIKNHININTDKNETEKPENIKFNFDPNTISADSLVMLGFSKSVADRWIKYRSKNPNPLSFEDITNIYGINNELILELKPLMIFPDKKQKEEIEPVNININSANFNDLEKFSFINKWLAERIIKYRDNLGGYYTVKQLKEVYGLDKKTYNQFEKYIILNEDEIKKINLNTAEFKEILSHPYLSMQDVKNISDFRQFKNNEIHSVEELRKNRILEDSVYLKVNPYLIVD